MRLGVGADLIGLTSLRRMSQLSLVARQSLYCQQILGRSRQKDHKFKAGMQSEFKTSKRVSKTLSQTVEIKGCPGIWLRGVVLA